MVAQFTGKKSPNQKRKANIRERLRRFAEFVHDTVSDWEMEERELATEILNELLEQIGNAGGGGRMRNRSPLTFTA